MTTIAIDDSAIEIETGEHPLFSIIWLHGLGAEAQDFESVVPVLTLKNPTPVRFIFPNAPLTPITMNNGYVSRAWYDILSAGKNTREIDDASLLASRHRIRAIIATENQRGIPCSRIFLAGFSQGGALAYFTAITHSEPLAGLIALSGYLPSSQYVLAEATQTNRSTPVFSAHGTDDDVVTPEFGYEAITTLVGLGYHPEWHTYKMGHEISITEMRDIGRWLRNRITNSLL